GHRVAPCLCSGSRNFRRPRGEAEREIISVLMDEVICPGVERKPRDPKQWNQQRNAPGVAQCCVNVAWAVVHFLRNTSRLLVLGDGLPRSGAPGSPSCSTTAGVV